VWGLAMKRTEVTYGQLDTVLGALRFSCRPARHEQPGHIHEHKSARAVIMLPDLPECDKVFQHHLVAVRTELDNFSLADPIAFAAKVKPG